MILGAESPLTEKFNRMGEHTAQIKTWAPSSDSAIFSHWSLPRFF